MSAWTQENEQEAMEVAKVLERAIRAGEPYVADLITALREARLAGRRDAPIDRERAEVYAEISLERAGQNAEWGGDTHDDEHSIIEWSLFIGKQAGKLSSWAIAMLDNTSDWPIREARGALVKIAAIAVAAIESIDRRAAAKGRQR
jgi:hypothetical protein